MRVRFFASDKDREQQLARAVAEGCEAHRCRAEVVPLSATPDIDGIDVACMVGVKSRRLFYRCLEAGVVPLMFDKGYVRTRRAGDRTWEYWRVSVGSHHPTEFLGGNYPPDRWDRLGIDVQRWRGFGLQILIAGSSAKYHEFYDLPEPTTWAKRVVEEIREYSDRPIIYRPKPSWDGAVPIRGTYFSGAKDPLSGALTNAWAVVTHGSNLCFEAALAGVPSIVLGNGVAKPISSTSLKDIEEPLMGDRGPWLHALAYWQWTEREMRKGRMWGFLKSKIEGKVR